jgi:hypothetical protein
MPTISGKAIGRRKPLFADFSFPLPAGESAHPQTLRGLIERIVRAEVEAFRDRQEERRLVRALTAREIEAGAAAGKIDAGGSEVPPQPVDADEAVAAAFTAYQDGLYLVAIDDEQYRDLDDIVSLGADSRITFVRLTLLAGG